MYGDTITVTQLYYTRAAADLGSFSRAAASLGVSQPALSHSIAALEHTLGGALFHRSTTGVTPTPLAQRVLPHIRALLSGIDALLVEARAATGQEASLLRVGVSPLIHPALVARAFQATRQLAPAAALILKEDNLVDLQAALFARRLDLILVPAVTEAAGCQRRRIDTEPMHYLPSTDPTTPPATDRQPIELADLSGRPLVMVGDACGLTTFTRSLFSTTGTQLLPYAGEADNYRSLEDWARLGLGGALMPASRFRSDERTRPVHNHGRPVTLDYEALWLTDTTRGAAIEAVLDTLAGSAARFTLRG
jgi:DNA-binding transcriptional LysR family regulator